MERIDLGNLLCTWEKCLIDLGDAISKLIAHMESGANEKAQMRAKETKKTIDKMMIHICKMKTHCVPEIHNGIERKI